VNLWLFFWALPSAALSVAIFFRIDFPYATLQDNPKKGFSLQSLTRTSGHFKTVALMEAASFCKAQRSKRYSGQQEQLPKIHIAIANLQIAKTDLINRILKIY